jgi:hypothetical protein
MKDTKRKEVVLPNEAIERLQILADKKKWSLKKFMESVLLHTSYKVFKGAK